MPRFRRKKYPGWKGVRKAFTFSPGPFRRFIISIEVQDVWQKNRYFYHEAKEPLGKTIDKLEATLEHWDEIIVMFPEAEDAIKTLEQGGKNRETIVAKADYSRAEIAWAEYYHETTSMYLRKIMAKVQEPALLPVLSILGLILLPALPRPR